MNKVYRSIYNEALGAWVATSEVSSACGKKTGSSRLLSKPQSENSANAHRRLQALSMSLLVLLGLGLSPTISYAQSFTLGAHNTATGAHSAAIGLDNTSTGAHSFTLGAHNTPSVTLVV